MTEDDRIEGMATLAAKACMTDVGTRLRSAILTDGLVTRILTATIQDPDEQREITRGMTHDAIIAAAKAELESLDDDPNPRTHRRGRRALQGQDHRRRPPRLDRRRIAAVPANEPEPGSRRLRRCGLRHPCRRPTRRRLTNLGVSFSPGPRSIAV